MTENEGRALRLYVDESDRHKGVPLHEWIVLKTRKKGITGVCAFRTILTQETPAVVELIHRQGKLISFLQLMHGVLAEGFTTMSLAEVRIFSWGKVGAGEP